MKYSLCIILVALFCVGISAQTLSRTDEAEAMKKAVEIITAAKKKPKVDVVLRDLREVNGKIVRVYDDSFVVEPKQEKNRHINIITVGTIPGYRKSPMTIRYGDVLQIEGKGVVLSFVPDPKLTPYSEWNAIPAVGVGALLQVHTTDGKKTNGAFITWTDDRIRLMRGNTQVEIARNDIVRVFQLPGEAKTRLAKTTEVGRQLGEVMDAVMRIMSATLIPLFYPAVAIGIAAAGVGAVVLMYVLRKGGLNRVLLYAA